MGTTKLKFRHRAAARVASMIGGREFRQWPAGDDRWYSPVRSVVGAAGVTVDADSAMRYSASYAGIRLLSECVGMLPCIMYGYDADGDRERATEHPLYRILKQRPNMYQTPFEFFRYIVSQVQLHGSGYAEVERRGNTVLALWPRPSLSVTPKYKDKEFYFMVREPDGAERKVPFLGMLQINAIGESVLKGTAPIDYGAEAIGTGVAMEQHAAEWFANGAHLDGVLTVPGKLDEERQKALKRAWDEAYSGAGKRHGTAVLQEGTDYKQYGATPKDSLLTEGRTHQIQEIGRALGVPPHLLGDLSQAHFTNIEHQSIEFVVYYLGTWLANIQQRLGATLLNEYERDDYFFEFLVDALLTGDIKARGEAQKAAINGTYMTPNEVRKLNNRKSVEGGDVLLAPVNYVPLDKLWTMHTTPVPSSASDNQDTATGADTEQDRSRLDLRESFADLIARTAHQLTRREAREIRKMAKRCDANALQESIKAYYGPEFAGQVQEAFAPVVECYAKTRTAMIAAERGISSPILNGFVKATIDAVTERYVTKHIDEISKFDSAEYIEQCLQDWEMSTAKEVGQSESTQIDESVTLEAERLLRIET